MDEAVQFKMWEHVGCADLPTFIREQLDLDPELVQWAISGLKTMKPNEPMPYAAAIEVGKLGAHGTNQHTRGHVQAHVIPSTGSFAYTLARLRRDDPEMAARVERGELTANAAAVTQGWRKPPDPVQQMRRLWDAASEEQRDAIRKWIDAQTIAELRSENAELRAKLRQRAQELADLELELRDALAAAHELMWEGA